MPADGSHRRACAYGGLLKDGHGLVMDVKGLLDRDRQPDGVELWRL